jgi:hypothetical protein
VIEEVKLGCLVISVRFHPKVRSCVQVDRIGPHGLFLPIPPGDPFGRLAHAGGAGEGRAVRGQLPS